jgi:hypothetical protein
VSFCAHVLVWCNFIYSYSLIDGTQTRALYFALVFFICEYFFRLNKLCIK